MPIWSPQQRKWRCATHSILVAIAIAGITLSGRAGPAMVGEMFKGKAAAVTDAVRAGDWETYFTGYAWHLPYGYHDATRARLNETTWGGGFGRTIFDEDGDRHSV